MIKMFKKISIRWKKFLERLAKVSKEEYGEHALSCCDVNKDVEYQKRHLEEKLHKTY